MLKNQQTKSNHEFICPLSLCRTLTFLSATTATWVHLHVFTSTNWPAQKVTRCTWCLSSGPAWWNHQVNRMLLNQLPKRSFLIIVCLYIIGLFWESNLAKCEGCPTICGFIFGTINGDESVGEGWGLALIKWRMVSSICSGVLQTILTTIRLCGAKTLGASWVLCSSVDCCLLLIKSTREEEAVFLCLNISQMC